jgi:hypothetical protein
LGGGGDAGGLVVGGVDDDGGVEVRAAGEAEGFDVALGVGFGLGDEEVVDGVAVGFEGGAVGTGEDDGVVEGEGGAGVFGQGGGVADGGGGARGEVGACDDGFQMGVRGGGDAEGTAAGVGINRD